MRACGASNGSMHNRVRMAAASFLIKHLLIDWREGEAWFWDTPTLTRQQSGKLAVGGRFGRRRSTLFRIFNPYCSGN